MEASASIPLLFCSSTNSEYLILTCDNTSNWAGANRNPVGFLFKSLSYNNLREISSRSHFWKFPLNLSNWNNRYWSHI